MEADARRGCVDAAAAYPAADQPPASQPACEAMDAYYGIGTPVDYARARACAYRGSDADVLAMLYANGQGVKRDFGVARKAVCDAGGAPAEISGRLDHLARMEQAVRDGTAPESFDFCDDITSGMMQGYCTKIAARQAGQKREAMQAALVAGWPAAHQAAYVPLRQAQAAFRKARDGEVDLSGTARAAMVIDEEEAVENAFSGLLARAEAGRLAAVAPGRARAADAALNATWKRLQATPDPEFDTVKLVDIVKAQRAWLKYRDAWIAFGRVRYPALPADAWIATLTEQRDSQLQDLLAARR
jgi:uncharacterized protein YecT (DUF1311 family)